MIGTPPDSPASKHTIPVIDRMMELLGAVEQREAGMTISDLIVVLGLPRTTEIGRAHV